MPSSPRVVQVAVPAPLRRLFDYRLPPGAPAPPRGARVRVPFGRRRLVGVVLGADPPSVPAARLKAVEAVLDEVPLLPETLLALLETAARYYHHPVGEVVHAALPAALRQGRPAETPGEEVWQLTEAGRAADPAALGRAALQKRLWACLRDHPEGAGVAALRALSANWRGAARALEARGWARPRRRPCLAGRDGEPETPRPPTPHQASAIEAVAGALGGFRGFLLHGVTGSGKTEVYLQLIQQVLERGEQALVLVPEIGLTPQLVERFRRRFTAPVAVLHSGLADGERLCAWIMAASGRAPIVLGTRSALFTPLARPGLIVVDEEHDPSFKQQEGFRYHARDLAILRARLEDRPVLLGSATPSLESLHNVRRGRLAELRLPARANAAVLPRVVLLDMRGLPAQGGISRPLYQAIKARLARGEQSLLFLNRRGYAPVLMCHACGWLAPCPRCDAQLTLHRGAGRLRCHHCGAEQVPPACCPQCGAGDLKGIGAGTERLEGALAERFPGARILRIDRDTTAGKGALEARLRQVHAGEADILVGTQMLGKGHHFPGVTLVGVVDADRGLYGFDFRAGEQLLQRIVQVAGRAGRADKPGEVLVQTHHPEHPALRALERHDYAGYAAAALEERAEAELPPFRHLALLRSEAVAPNLALEFLRAAHRAAGPLAGGEVTLFDPVPAPMERRAGRHRAQLMVQGATRPALHRFLDPWLDALEALPLARRVRWSLDVDPVDLY